MLDLYRALAVPGAAFRMLCRCYVSSLTLTGALEVGATDTTPGTENVRNLPEDTQLVGERAPLGTQALGLPILFPHDDCSTPVTVQLDHHPTSASGRN